MSKRALVVLAIAALCIIGIFVVAVFHRSMDKGVTIGAILPLTGDSATYGSTLKRGMDLALEEVNAKGGINGKPLRIVYEDDAGKPTTGVTAFNKLVSADRAPLVIGGMFSAVTLAVAPVAERRKIVLLSPTSSAVELTNAGDYIFRIYPSDTYDGVFLAEFAFNALQARRVAIIYLQVSSVSAVTEVFKKEFESRGGVITVSEAYKEGVTDFRSQISKATKDNPDIVFIPGYLKEMSTLLRQATELGVSARFLSISTFYDPKILQLAGDAANGVMFSSPAFDPKSNSQETLGFVKAYQAKFGGEPDILAAYGYDVVKIAALALGDGTASSDDIKANLYGIKNYPGVTGNTTFDSNGDVTKDLKILKVDDGLFVPY